MISTLFESLNDKTNPFYIIDKKQIITRANLVGRIKAIQKVLLELHPSKVVILNKELTANSVATCLACILLGVDIIFLDYKEDLEILIRDAIKKGGYTWFTDRAMIDKIKNKKAASQVLTVINLNTYTVKIEAETALPEVYLAPFFNLSQLEEFTEDYSVEYTVKKNDVVNVYEINKITIFYGVILTICAGATLQLRNQALKDHIVIMSFNAIKPILKLFNINLVPIFERNIVSDINYWIYNNLSIYRFKKAINKKLFVYNTPAPIPYPFNVLDSPDHYVDDMFDEDMVNLLAYFNLPIKSSFVDTTNLFIVPDCTVISSEDIFRKNLEDFKTKVYARYHIRITNVVSLPE